MYIIVQKSAKKRGKNSKDKGRLTAVFEKGNKLGTAKRRFPHAESCTTLFLRLRHELVTRAVTPSICQGSGVVI